MKILFIHAIGKTKFGGGEKWVLTAAKGLRNKGHEAILGCRPRSVLSERAKELGIPVVHFNIVSDVSVYNVMKISQFLRREKIDVLVSKNRDFGVAGTAGWLAGTPVVLVRHGLPLRKNILKHRFLINKLADGIIVNANMTKELYVAKNWFDNNFIHVIYNGIGSDHECDPIPFGTMYPGKKIVLSVGRLVKQKGYSYLVRAAKLLRERRDDFLIMVLGEGNMRETLKNQADELGVSDCIQLPGFVKNVGPYMKGCDIFVLPSLYEGLSNAAIEAMSFGKPAVLSEVNGSREIVTPGENGYIVPLKDDTALAGAIFDLLDNDERRKVFGNCARVHVHERFGVGNMIHKLERLFQEKLQGKA
jgi:glycosyltransferase involved in cell wall biosynthesis